MTAEDVTVVEICPLKTTHYEEEEMLAFKKKKKKKCQPVIELQIRWSYFSFKLTSLITEKPPLVPCDLFQSVTHSVPVDKKVIEYGSWIDLHRYSSTVEFLSTETSR